MFLVKRNDGKYIDARGGWTDCSKAYGFAKFADAVGLIVSCRLSDCIVVSDAAAQTVCPAYAGRDEWAI